MSPAQTTEAIRFLLSAYPSQRMRMGESDIRGMHAAYAAGFADLEFENVKAAISRLARTEKWLPTIADVREAIGVIAHGNTMSGSEAWGSVLKAIREMGQRAQPGVDFVFADPITARTVSALGWFDLCASDNQIADRSRFCEAYNQISKTERTEAKAAPGAISNVLPMRAPIPAIERGGDAQGIGAIVGGMLKEPAS